MQGKRPSTGFQCAKRGVAGRRLSHPSYAPMAKSPKASQRSVFAAHVWYGPFFLFPRRNGFQGHFRAKERALRRESPCRNFADSRKSCVRKGFRPSFGRGRASDCEISDGFSHDQPSDAIARFSCLDLTAGGEKGTLPTCETHARRGSDRDSCRGR